MDTSFHAGRAEEACELHSQFGTELLITRSKTPPDPEQDATNDSRNDNEQINFSPGSATTKEMATAFGEFEAAKEQYDKAEV